MHKPTVTTEPFRASSEWIEENAKYACQPFPSISEWMRQKLLQAHKEKHMKDDSVALYELDCDVYKDKDCRKQILTGRVWLV